MLILECVSADFCTLSGVNEHARPLYSTRAGHLWGGDRGGGDLLKNNADSMAYLVHFLYKHIFLSGFMLKFIIFVYIGGILGCINAFWIY